MLAQAPLAPPAVLIVEQSEAVDIVGVPDVSAPALDPIALPLSRGPPLA